MIIIMSYFLVTQKYISYYDNDEKGGKYTFKEKTCDYSNRCMSCI